MYFPWVSSCLISSSSIPLCVSQSPHYCPLYLSPVFLCVRVDEEGTGKKKVTLIVFNTMFGVNISESPLKERVAFDKHSLIIKALEMKDAGSYTCSISTFPSGTFEGTTKLVVQETKPLSAGIVLAIVTAVLLLLAIMVAMLYFIHIRRRHSSAGFRFVIDTTGPERELQSSATERDQDVVYSDIKVKPSRDASPLTNYKLRESGFLSHFRLFCILVFLSHLKCFVFLKF
uniref:Immunoglobulin V-set domain-containing protein n=1 Tax=Pundamilia nyererei TaxID=303518 RepID=A0A3B4H1P2_9CICH